MAETEDLNNILTRVGPDTAMGNLFRRFWHPALLGAEVERDGSPVRLRILGEDLVAFRDTSGRIGIISAYCPHRGAPLYFGRNEDCGLRCVYHGWKFDVSGRCQDVPNIVPPDNFDKVKQRLSIIGYPVEEAGGIAWVYMGPLDHKPPLPNMAWLSLPPEQVHVSRWLQRSNWAQGFEGEIDSAHLSFIHGLKNYKGTMQEVVMQDGAPKIVIRETETGFVYGARRDYNGGYYWRVTNWLLPTWSVTAPFVESQGYHGRAWLPIDDEHTCSFAYKYQPNRPYTEEEIADTDSGWTFPPRIEKGTYALGDGTVIDTFLPIANRENDYLIDRLSQQSVKYSGIYGINEEDRGIQEGMRMVPGRPGTIDRRFENLVQSDAAILAARRKLVKLAREVDAGRNSELGQSGDLPPLGAIGLVTPIADFDELLAAYPEVMSQQKINIAAE